MRFLGLLVRLVAITIIVNLVWRLLVSWFGSRGNASQRQAGSGDRERAGGALVRDPQCGTYVIQSRALQIGSGDHAHFFCSDTCRTAWMAAHPR